MIVAIIGTRNLNIDIAKYIPKEATCIISSGAKGIDELAEQYANEKKPPYRINSEILTFVCSL